MSDDNQPRINTMAMLGTYVPRQCGIGTFTHDLRNAVAGRLGDDETQVLAMDDTPDGYPYPEHVRFQIRDQEQRDYRNAAEMLNINQVGATCVQHEFGIYGGKDGSYVLDLMRRLRMPIITTLHTVLREPSRSQAVIMREIGRLSDRLVVMSKLAGKMLKATYDIDEEKVTFIPHGIPDVPFVDPSFHKDQFGFEGRTVLLTFGLLSPNKGIEVAIEAMRKVVDKHPDALYVVLGATHPGVLRNEGDAYRNKLERRVDKLGLRDNVVFHNRFVELSELVRYIGAADIYVTPYLNEAQITSGTLAYALGAGKAVVSTPYWYAEEMLAEGRGKLVPFKDPAAMAEGINALLDDEVERAAIRKRAYLHCREMTWDNVARQYIEVANQAHTERSRNPRVLVGPRLETDGHETIPEISTNHLQTLTDEVGILSHAVYSVPDRRYGYRTDDNAAALIAALRLHDYRHDPQVRARIPTYLAFLRDAFNPETDRFRNVLSYERRWRDEVASEQTHGRAILAMGVATELAPTEGERAFATRMFSEAIEPVEQFSSSRAWAFALVGIHAYLSRYGGDTQARRIRKSLASRLDRRFVENARDDWPWHEQMVREGSAKVAHAMILSGQWLPDSEMVGRGLRALDWLVDQQLHDGVVSLFGDQGWADISGERAHFNQWPTEAMHLIEACGEAYRCTREKQWIDRARGLLGWFLGDNDLQAMLYDNRTGGCRDALRADGPNQNQGAAATLAWLNALVTVYELVREGAVDTSVEAEAEGATLVDTGGPTGDPGEKVTS